MAFYSERVLPHLVDRTCGIEGFDRWRKEAVEGLSGTVLEIGFGSGLNVALYPEDVERVVAVEPSAVARRLAEPRISERGVTVEHVGLDGSVLEMEDHSVDAALCTFTLCTIPDVDAALSEVRRVLRPGGRFQVLEHGLAPDPGVVRWQRRMEPLQKVMAGGCHLTREPLVMLERAGFHVESSRSRYGKGPKPWRYLTVAHSTSPG